MTMTDLTLGLALLGGMLTLLIAGVPIGYALLTAGLAGLVLTRPLPAAEFLLSTFAHSASAHLAYVVLPLFLFMGHMCFSAGIGHRAFDSARVWVGSLPGGLAITTVFACAGFAAVSGSSLATSATVAQVAVPRMLREGYSQAIASGTVAAAGTLGVLIPPSGLLIVYAISTDTSIVDLFLAGIVPGVMTALFYAVMLFGWVKLVPGAGPSHSIGRTSFRAKARAVVESWEIVILFLIVMGTIYLGIGTATEAAAFGAAGALAIVLFRGKDRWRIVWRGLIDTGVTTSCVFLLVIGAGLFGLALTTTQVPQHFTLWLTHFDLPVWQLTVVLLLPYLVLGLFVDGITMMLLTLPIIFPVVQHAGINPVLFGILVTKCAEIGAITPPVGLNIFVVKNTVPEIDLLQAFRGSIPFVLVELLIIGLLIAFNDIALVLL
ncbi:TRAP transporter, DctM subunit [Tistlia consotensis]|uniref:TRAP transporter large permease protein n=1 Tax=Tistlia consotensis USBA 355 TaxID=560819 RepID=A0A1Y6BZ13_9PROT|nr:TRAP transporter large permease [Tistlia consotensis]SMF36851.1 TRAP transporter, DctM subunit [Tistlia consotensis USBA 355]SNR72198.1 TRAP transporter, DctM subunit [Tistlia consotensis]